MTEFLEKKKKDLEKHEASKVLDGMKHPDIATLVGSTKYGSVISSQSFPTMTRGTRSNYAVVIEYLPSDPNIQYNLVEYGYTDRKSKDEVNLNVRFVDGSYGGIPQEIYDKVFARINKLSDAATSVKVPSDEMNALRALKLVSTDSDKVQKYLDYTAVSRGADNPTIRYGYFNLLRGAFQVNITNKSQLKLDSGEQVALPLPTVKSTVKEVEVKPVAAVPTTYPMDAPVKPVKEETKKTQPVEVDVINPQITPEDIKPEAKFSWSDDDSVSFKDPDRKSVV